MNKIQVFQNSEFGALGVQEVEGKPYFPATACAKKLCYANPQKAIRDHCKGVNEMVTPTIGGTQTMRYIPEGDLYRLITHSKLPSAERFEAWVFDEVLPSIRKTGGYGQPRGLSLEQIIQVIQATVPVVISMMANASTEQPSSATEVTPVRHRKPQKKSGIIRRLDPEIHRRVDYMLKSGQYYYDEIALYLKECGIQISASSICRYARGSNL